MTQGEHIFDFYIESEAVVNLLNRLKGTDRLLFAMTDDVREDLEEELGYTVDASIVASSTLEETKELMHINNTFKWFESKNDRESKACIDTNRFFYMGCVLEEGKELRDARAVFSFWENLLVQDHDESTLFIGARKQATIYDFMRSLDGYQMIDFGEPEGTVWLPKGSEYFEIWKDYSE